MPFECLRGGVVHDNSDQFCEEVASVSCSACNEDTEEDTSSQPCTPTTTASNNPVSRDSGGHDDALEGVGVLTKAVRETNTETTVDLKKLARKLAGEPSALRGYTIPCAILLFVWKTALFVIGICTIPYAWDLLNHKKVVVPFAQDALLLYTAMNVLDTIKNIIQRDGVSHFVHHFVTASCTSIQYLRGSDRSIAVTVLMFLFEIVAPALQVFKVMKHLKLGGGRFHLWLARLLYWQFLIGRMMVFQVYIYIILVNDIYHSIMDNTDIECFEDIQPYGFCIPSLVCSLVVMYLDVNRLGDFARSIDALKKILARRQQEKSKSA